MDNNKKEPKQSRYENELKNYPIRFFPRHDFFVTKISLFPFPIPKIEIINDYSTPHLSNTEKA